MAIPITLTSNSPAPGYFSWTAFSIQWDGVGYQVPAGNSNNKFVWWQFNGGTPVIAGSDTLPVLGPEDYLLFLNKNGVALIVDFTQVVEGSLVVSGSIIGDAIAANQIDTMHLKANSITATQIAANAVTTSALSVGTVGDDLVANGSFEDGTQGWEVKASGAGATADVVTGVSSSGVNALRMIRGTAANLEVGQAPAKFIPVTAVAGRRWYIAVRAGTTATSIPSGFYVRIMWWQANKTSAASTPYSDVVVNSGLTNSWSLYEGQTPTPPTNARYMEVRLINANSGSTILVDEVTAREVIISAQIGAGAITAATIAANAVGANQIAANAITASKMVVTDFTNLADDPEFVTPLGAAAGAAGSAWYRRSGSAASSVIATVTGLPGRAVQLNGVSTEVSVATNNLFNLDPGSPFYITFRAQNSLTPASVAYLRLYWYKQDVTPSSVLAYSEIVVPASTGWADYSGYMTAPSDARYAQIVAIHASSATGGSWWVGRITVRRRLNGSLIVDGALDAFTITAPIIRTSATNPRVEFTSAGLKQFDAGGAVITQITPTGGLVATGVNVSGAITATSGTISGDLVVSGSLVAGDPANTTIPTSGLQDGLLYAQSGQYVNDNGNTVTDRAELRDGGLRFLSGIGAANLVARIRVADQTLVIDSNNKMRIPAIVGDTNSDPTGIGAFPRPVIVTGDGTLQASTGGFNGGVITAGSVDKDRLPGLGGMNGTLNNSQLPNAISISGNLTAQGAYDNPLSSNYTVAYVNTSGRIARVTSSRRYKDEIQDAVWDYESMLTIPTRSFRYTNPDLDSESPEPVYRHDIGFIAEEMYEVESWRYAVVLDDQGRPDGVNYDRVAVGHHALLQEAFRRIEALEAAVGSAHA